MSENIPDQEFFELADSFIRLANQHRENIPATKVSSAFLYAAARYNAFVAASADGADPESEREVVIEYFTQQYRKMISENMDDYIKNPL